MTWYGKNSDGFLGTHFLFSLSPVRQIFLAASPPRPRNHVFDDDQSAVPPQNCILGPDFLGHSQILIYLKGPFVFLSNLDPPTLNLQIPHPQTLNYQTPIAKLSIGRCILYFQRKF